MKNLKSTKGFTLVELIVVIAILGILAAVAVPAYSGYLTKAKEAGDQQVVSAVNTAIQSACAGQGLTSSQVTVAATLNSGAIDVTFSAKTGTGNATAAQAALISSDYATFVSGNNLKLNYCNKVSLTSDNLVQAVYDASVGG